MQEPAEPRDPPRAAPSSPPHFDVALIGGGPAGLATAARLRKAGQSVVVLERTAYDGLRIGESFGPELGPLLSALGALTALQPELDAQAGFASVRSAWGSDTLEERFSITNPYGAGWHVDRASFDRAMGRWARSSGVDLRLGTGTCTVQRTSSGFVVRPRAGSEVTATRLIDATGRGATVATRLGLGSWLPVDRQVAMLVQCQPSSAHPVEPGLVLEAAPQGFWYSTTLADASLLVVLVTDSDILNSLGESRDERFTRALADTHHTRLRLAPFASPGSPQVFRSDSGFLFPQVGPNLRAVGDAAMGTDPLGGNGVARALQSALDVPVDGDWTAPPLHPGQAFSDYLDIRGRYYLLEGRWPESPFWARRRPLWTDGTPVPWQEVPLRLPPEMPVRWRSPWPPGAEAWLPYPLLELLAQSASQAVPAHELLRSLASSFPLPVRRLLVGLEWLLDAGVLEPA